MWLQRLVTRIHSQAKHCRRSLHWSPDGKTVTLQFGTTGAFVGSPIVWRHNAGRRKSRAASTAAASVPGVVGRGLHGCWGTYGRLG